MKRFALLGLLVLAGCSQSDPKNGGSPTPMPTVEPQSALNPQSNASPKNNLPPKMGNPNGACPPGATAACKDGSFTDSNNRKIACNGHGGVAKWCK
jgi:hypothetical protein